MKFILCLLCALPLFAGQGTGDEKSIALADQVMEAMGGKKAWDDTRFISWKFFGRRVHVWDKHTGDIRVENGKGLTILMNLNTRKGQAWQEDTQLEGEDLEKALKSGWEMWVNDAYWLVMPYKLRDPGVHLVYAREGQTEDGRACDILTMTFQEVGVTPENKYEIYIDKESNLVTAWSFFKSAGDEKPGFTNPWGNWVKHGNIMLSDDRGEGRFATAIADVKVHTEVPEGTFTNAAPVTL